MWVQRRNGVWTFPRRRGKILLDPLKDVNSRSLDVAWIDLEYLVA